MPAPRNTVLAALACALLAAAACASAGSGDASTTPYEIGGPQEAWIPMPDGVRLSADLFLPRGGQTGERFPVLLEYLPYRKVEDRGRNHALYSYFVRRGY